MPRSSGTSCALDGPPILGKTYVKNSGHGGGTGILSRGEPGVRPLASLGGCLEGRAFAGVAECIKEVTVRSLYGISGMAAHRQIPLWSAIANTLARAGRPFILAADWQVHPRELAALRLDRHLDATIVAPSVATNHVSGNIIDYFLVSNSLLAASDDGTTVGVDVETICGCRFSPHRPVRLRVAIRREVQWIRRLTQPRLLDVERPVGPQKDTEKVDWVAWDSGLATGGDRDHDDGALTKAVLEWSAGVEHELFGIFGVTDPKQAERFSGIGLPRDEVWANGNRRFASTPDDLGLLGHRLAWAARALHGAVVHAAPILAEGAAVALRLGRAGAWLQHSRWKRSVLQGRAPWPCKDVQAQESWSPPWQYEVLYRYGSRAGAFLREDMPSDRYDEAHFVQVLNEALRLLSKLARRTRPLDAIFD